jgi:muconolactone delta-isomerase
MLFLVQGRAPSTTEPTPEFLGASKSTLERLGELQRQGKLIGGGVMIGPLGVAFLIDAESNEDLHVILTTLPSFRYADWDVMPLIRFQFDIDVSLNDALARAEHAAGS